MSSNAKEIDHLRAIQQAQQSLEFAAVACGGVELEGKSASIKSISECIHFSNASSLSSCFSRISLAGSRRQLSIDKNKRQRGSDEPYAPLLVDFDTAVEELNMVVGAVKSDETDHKAAAGLN